MSTTQKPSPSRRATADAPVVAACPWPDWDLPWYRCPDASCGRGFVSVDAECIGGWDQVRGEPIDHPVRRVVPAVGS